MSEAGPGWARARPLIDREVDERIDALRVARTAYSKRAHSSAGKSARVATRTATTAFNLQVSVRVREGRWSAGLPTSVSGEDLDHSVRDLLGGFSLPAWAEESVLQVLVDDRGSSFAPGPTALSDAVLAALDEFRATVARSTRLGKKPKKRLKRAAAARLDQRLVAFLLLALGSRTKELTGQDVACCSVVAAAALSASSMS